MTTGWRVLSIDHREPVAPFEDVVRLIDAAGTATAAAYSRSDVVEALHEHQPAAVAVSGGRLVGAAVARVCGADAHLLALALHPQWRNRGIGSALLRELDQGVIHHGAHRLLALVEPGQVGEVAFANQGFTRLDGLHLYIRAASMVPEELAVVERYGGHFPPPGLLGSMKGFSSTKDLLERRIVAPLSHADLADRIGLVPPAAVMLFGPPGTGKTSFARAVASRLSWSFVELHPSLLGQGSQAAVSLRDALDDLRRVDRLVCFIDEADEIASARATRPDSQPIVNELLKAIPAFKDRPGRLMIMATNSIAAIDPAMLRPGRFDLIIPIGAPDRHGRAELAAEFLPACDAADVAARTEGFTPADFALAAQRSAQLAFERALSGTEADVTAADCLAAIAATKASVNADATRDFELEERTYARL
ncbi:MAG TPA: bifunctional GNAT family N-acetyltransferase/ATP-binding protein [Acidimicrobiales bacterium]|nr:bifunctional GNAT family N-acetyltransferase/ATP-binding protein [Acidimicrobiales bacterium]